MSGEGSGYSASGGAAGPSQAGLTSNSSFNVGGNAGIGATSGMAFSLPMLAVIGLIAIGVSIVLTRGRR